MKAILFALLLSACSTPVQFVLGDVVPAPGGCIEARQRGHQC